MWLSVYDTMQIVQQEWFRLDAMHAPRERDETVKAEKQRSGALNRQIGPLALSSRSPIEHDFLQRCFPNSNAS